MSTARSDLAHRLPRDARVPLASWVGLIRLALAPLLAWQGRRLRRSVPALAEAVGAREGVAGHGPVCLRLLVVGDSSAAGVGVRTQDEALAPQLAQAMAQQLSQQTQRHGRGPSAVAWQLVAATGLDARGALAHMAAQRLHPADVLVTVLGVNDAIAGTAPAAWLQTLDAIRSHARHHARVRFVVHCAPPRMDLMPALPQPLRWVLGATAARLDAALRRHVRQAHRRSRFALPFDPVHEEAAAWFAADGFHPNAALYRRWAGELADHIDLDLSQVPGGRAVLPSGFQPSAISAFGGLGAWDDSAMAPAGEAVARAPRAAPAPVPVKKAPILPAAPLGGRPRRRA